MHIHQFDEVFSIMEQSFPEDEYRTYGEQKELLFNPHYQIYVLKDLKNNQVKAFITIWKFDDFAFIEHFAVNQNYRNQGLGACMLKEINTLLSCQLCLEVELPETDYAKRRIEFYKRNGFYLNEYPYIQPAISKGKNPLKLFIMTSESHISMDEFERIKTIIYKNVYKVL